MLYGLGMGFVSIATAAMVSFAPMREVPQEEYSAWSCTGWDSYNDADCHRWGGGSWLLFDWYSYVDCYSHTADVVMWVSPTRTSLTVTDYGSLPGDEYLPHLATCIVNGMNAE